VRAFLREIQAMMGHVGRHEAEQLLSHVMGVSRAELLTAAAEPTEAQKERARELARRRAAGEPLQHLQGWVPFLDARVRVGAGALVPRPETEFLTATALEEWRRMGSPRPHVALDVGTGSGCIAAALAVAVPGLTVKAMDISAEALAWAARTVKENRLQGRVELLRGDLYAPLEQAGFPERGASLIVANPPYVAESERAELPVEVAEHEPEVALFGGPLGLDAITRVIEEAPRWLAAPGLLAVEIGWKHAEAAQGIAERAGAFTRIEVRRDLAGQTRMLLAWRG
jgi:release factor glutamine methyltransferase